MAITSAQRRPNRRQSWLAGLVLLVFLVSLLTYQNGGFNFGVYRLDLDVYRVGAKAWMEHVPLYGPLPPISNGMIEPFTYPPISAVLMAPLALVTTTTAGVLMTAVSVGLLICVLKLFLQVSRIATGPGSWKLAAAMLPLAVLIEPVRTTLAYGQINIVLMFLVSFDCLLPTTWFTVRGRTIGWPRGALTGAAAALKLTPLVFILFFIARKDWKGCLGVAGGFAVVTGLGFAFAPHDSWQYFTSTVFDTSRIGPHVFSGNQSLTGVLFRAHLTGTTENRVWLGVCVLVGILALTAIYRALSAGKMVTALALNASTELLVSPVSWSHHWVWAAPVLVCALVKGWGMWRRKGLRPRYFAAAVAVTLVFLAEPQVWFPHTNNKELGWAWWEQIIGSAYVWVGVLALLLCAFRFTRREAVASSPPQQSDSDEVEEPSDCGNLSPTPSRR